MSRQNYYDFSTFTVRRGNRTTLSDSLRPSTESDSRVDEEPVVRRQIWRDRVQRQESTYIHLVEPQDRAADLRDAARRLDAGPHRSSRRRTVRREKETLTVWAEDPDPTDGDDEYFSTSHESSLFEGRRDDETLSWSSGHQAESREGDPDLSSNEAGAEIQKSVSRVRFYRKKTTAAASADVESDSAMPALWSQSSDNPFFLSAMVAAGPRTKRPVINKGFFRASRQVTKEREWTVVDRRETALTDTLTDQCFTPPVVTERRAESPSLNCLYSDENDRSRSSSPDRMRIVGFVNQGRNRNSPGRRSGSPECSRSNFRTLLNEDSDIPTADAIDEGQSCSQDQHQDPANLEAKKSYKTFPNSCLKSISSHSSGSRTKSSVRFKLDDIIENRGQEMAKRAARMEPFPRSSECINAKGDSKEGLTQPPRILWSPPLVLQASESSDSAVGSISRDQSASAVDEFPERNNRDDNAPLVLVCTNDEDDRSSPLLVLPETSIPRPSSDEAVEAKQILGQALRTESSTQTPMGFVPNLPIMEMDLKQLARPSSGQMGESLKPLIPCLPTANRLSLKRRVTERPNSPCIQNTHAKISWNNSTNLNSPGQSESIVKQRSTLVNKGQTDIKPKEIQKPQSACRPVATPADDSVDSLERPEIEQDSPKKLDQLRNARSLAAKRKELRERLRSRDVESSGRSMQRGESPENPLRPIWRPVSPNGCPPVSNSQPAPSRRTANPSVSEAKEVIPSNSINKSEDTNNQSPIRRLPKPNINVIFSKAGSSNAGQARPSSPQKPPVARQTGISLSITARQLSNQDASRLIRPTSRKPHLSPSRPMSSSPTRKGKSMSPSARNNLTLQRPLPAMQAVKSAIEEHLTAAESEVAEVMPGQETVPVVVLEKTRPMSASRQDKNFKTALVKNRRIGHPLRNMTLEQFREKRRQGLSPVSDTSATVADEPAPQPEQQCEEVTIQRPFSQPVTQKAKSPLKTSKKVTANKSPQRA